VLLSRPTSFRSAAFAAASAAALTLAAVSAASAETAAQGGEVVVTARPYVAPTYTAPIAQVGPLGAKPVLDTAMSITTVPEDLIVNVGARTVNDALRYLPSVTIRNQQGYEVSRPQSRGFQGSIVQDTRMDGLNIVGTTANPAEGLAGVQVINGATGSLYGPQPLAGVFNYMLKRPTDALLLRLVGSYDSQGVFTEQGDIGDRVGPLGFRLNVMHGQGESWVDFSHVDRTLAQGDFDVHLGQHTVLELDAFHYETEITGLPGSIVYFGGGPSGPGSTFLPKAPDPTTVGLGQPGAGTDLTTNLGMAKLKHDFGDWKLELGALYSDAYRGLYGITNALTDDLGNYTVTKNFNAIPHYTIFSNMASLNGHVTLAGLTNDVTLGTNGFINGQNTYFNSIAVALGKGNLANPTVLPTKPTPANGGTYKSGRLQIQSLIAGDEIHLTPQWALQGVLSTSFLKSESWAKTGVLTSSDSENWVWSPTVSLIYKPMASVSVYATWSNSVEQGEQAPAGTANANAFLKPYRDEDYEGGVKYAPTADFLVTAGVFHMTRPLAQTVAATNVFQVIGTQRDWGLELYGQGSPTPDLSLLGGVTYVDARLEGSMIANTNDKRVVGVPEWKADLAADYHPAVLHGLALTGALHFESDRAATNVNNSFAPSYATVDLGLRYSASFWGHHETARFQVMNVGDTHYYTAIADGNIVGSAGANTAYIALPRTVMASVEFDY
jgi:iron complex outermembrane receptor protein